MAVELWTLTAAANVVIVAVYAGIAWVMIRDIVAGKQWFSNPLATATAAIFITCTVGHGVHLEHTLLPLYGPMVGIAMDGEATGVAAAARAAFSDPRLVVWDIITAGVAIWYFTLRSRLALVVKGAALCEDMAQREKEALALHDNVVQGLARAKLSLDLGRREEGRRAVEETLEASKRIISGLLGRPGSELAMGPGDLRRNAPGR